MQSSFRGLTPHAVQYPEEIAKDPEVQEKIRVLENYLGSGQWMQDFECDERGELPVDLKRGVLSEDALYNLLEDVKGENNHLKEEVILEKL